MKNNAIVLMIVIIAAVSGCASKDEFQPLDLISAEEISQRKRDQIATIQSQQQSAPPQPLAVPAPSPVQSQPLPQD